MRRRLRAEGGFGVIEVLVSATLLVIIAAGAFGALETAGRTTAYERTRSRAQAISQDDQARLRTLPISRLANLSETRTVVQDGSTYTVVSRGRFVTDSTGAASCATSNASADYLKITSTVSWPNIGTRRPIAVTSLVAPPSGSIASNRGSLAVQVVDANEAGIAGVGISGSGPTTFADATNEQGCVIFGNLPAGNYSLFPDASGLVDRDGKAPASRVAGVVGGTTSSVTLQYDRPGSIAVSFTTQMGPGAGGLLTGQRAERIVVFNTGMTQAAVFGAAGSSQASITASPLFPFTSPDSVYAGACEGDNPDPQTAAIAAARVPAGGSVNATVRMPALALLAYAARTSAPVAGARVTLADRNCSENGRPVTQAQLTDASGALPYPGVPYSVYDVCVEWGGRVTRVAGVSVKDMTKGTPLSIDVADTTRTTPGTCP